MATYYKSSLTGQQIENALLASKQATSLNGIVKYNGASGGTSSVSLAVEGTDYSAAPLVGTTAPTTSTAGIVGQFYVNTSTGKVYVCKAISGQTYTWVEVSGDDTNAVWGNITGTLSAQTDLQSALDAKVPATRTVNSKALSSNITLDGTDINVDDDASTVQTIKAKFDEIDGELDDKVDTTTTVNGHALSADVTIADTDIAHGSSTVGATLTSQSSQIVELQNLGFSVVDGEINITYEE